MNKNKFLYKTQDKIQLLYKTYSWAIEKALFDKAPRQQPST
jgi:hypothetical protein